MAWTSILTFRNRLFRISEGDPDGKDSFKTDSETFQEDCRRVCQESANRAAKGDPPGRRFRGRQTPRKAGSRPARSWSAAAPEEQKIPGRWADSLKARPLPA